MKKKGLIFGIITLLIVALTCVIVSVNNSIEKSISLAMEYIGNNTTESGRFVYRNSLVKGVKYDSVKYNALRHAGTLYSMYLYEKKLNDNSLKEKRILASKYFVDNYVKEVSPKVYAVISKPEEEGLSYSKAKLGGSGLALIALSNLYPENKIDLKILRGLGYFIISLQQPNGNYYSSCDPNKFTIDTKFVSLYYPGEAALGLLYLNDVDPNPKWVASAKKALLYLAKSRKGKGTNVPFDHWAMLATQKLLETPKNTVTPQEKLLLQKHAEQMARKILAQRITDEKDPYYGSLKNNQRLCSMGTIMEGFVAIYNIIDDVDLKKQVLETLKTGTSFLSLYQVKKGPMAGGIPTDARWITEPHHVKYNRIQIDNVQHVMSAWITYKELKKK